MANIKKLTLSQNESVTASKSKQQKSTAKTAQRDQLTGTYSKNYFDKMLKEVITDHKVNKKIFCLVMMNVNNLKKINMLYSHQSGDQLLAIFAKRVASVLKKPHCLARVSDDQFVAVLQNIDKYSSAAAVAKRILNNTNKPYKIGDKKIACEANIGIASYPIAGETPEELMRHAEFAAAEIKDYQKKWRFYSDELEKQFTEFTSLEHHLDKAFNEKELYCLYQPQVDITCNKIQGFELLLRWHHPEEGEISPETFIPIIEKSGRTEEANNYVVKSLLENLRYFTNCSPLKMSINLSPAVEDLAAHLQEVSHNLKKHKDNQKIQLELEITESSFIDSNDKFEQEVKHSMTLLSKQGIHLAIDDFGVKYSSIHRLMTYKFNTIKIDKVFVHKLDSDDSNAAKAIIKVILSLAQDIGAAVVAEGAETEAQVNILRELGCHIIQGFYFYPPLTLENASKLVNGM